MSRTIRSWSGAALATKSISSSVVNRIRIGAYQPTAPEVDQRPVDATAAARATTRCCSSRPRSVYGFQSLGVRLRDVELLVLLVWTQQQVAIMFGAAACSESTLSATAAR